MLGNWCKIEELYYSYKQTDGTNTLHYILWGGAVFHVLNKNHMYREVELVVTITQMTFLITSKLYHE